MKKYIIAVVLIIVVLAALLPFVSKTPDGLQSLVANNSAAQEPTWNGIIGDYSIVAVNNPYLSALLAGIIGTTVVFLVAFIFGKASSKKKNKPTESL